MRRRAVLAGLGVSAFGPSLGRAQGAVPVLDAHLHPARNLRRGANLNSAIPTVLREMDQFGVSQAILLPPPFMNEEGGVYGVSELSSAVRGQARLAFTAGGESLNPLVARYTGRPGLDRPVAAFHRRGRAQSPRRAPPPSARSPWNISL